DTVGAVEYRVCDIRWLGASRETARNHRLEHLRRSNDRPSRKICFRNNLLLNVGNLFDRHFHSQIATRYHDAIGRGENFVEVRERVGPLDLCNNERLSAHLCRSRSYNVYIRGALNKRLAHGVDTVFERELKTGAVVFGKRADAQIDAGKI